MSSDSKRLARHRFIAASGPDACPSCDGDELDHGPDGWWRCRTCGVDAIGEWHRAPEVS